MPWIGGKNLTSKKFYSPGHGVGGKKLAYPHARSMPALFGGKNIADSLRKVKT
jgi:hypothetical protein